MRLLRTASALNLALALGCAVLLATAALAQERSSQLPRASPNASASFTVGVTDVTVTYGAPSVRGREVFGELEPYGEVWRTGANEATTITFSTDVEVEDQPLAAGTYALLTIPGEDEWTVIFNRDANQWGAYNYNDSEDVLRVTVEPMEKPFVEVMAFHFHDLEAEDGEHEVDLVLRWADTAVAVEIESDTEDLVRQMAEGAAAAGDDWQIPYTYARYALQNEMYDGEALGWARAAMDRETNFNTVSLVARLLAAGGNYDDAAEMGNRALSMAREMNEAPNGMTEFEAEVMEWRGQG